MEEGRCHCGLDPQSPYLLLLPGRVTVIPNEVRNRFFLTGVDP